MTLLAPPQRASANGVVPPASEVERLRAANFTRRGDYWYIACSQSGPWMQYAFFGVRNLAPTFKRQKLTSADSANHIAERIDVVFSGSPALYFFTRDHQWLEFGEPLSLTYHASLNAGVWKYVLEENDEHYCGIGEPQHKPAPAEIPALSEPVHIK